MSEQKVVSTETIIHRLPDSVQAEAARHLEGHLGTTHQDVLRAILIATLETGLTTVGVDIGSFRFLFNRVCSALDVTIPPDAMKLSTLLQDAITGDERLGQIHMAWIETESRRKIAVVDRDAIASETSTIESFFSKPNKRQEASEDVIHRGSPPNSWEYIPKLLEDCSLHSFELPYRPDHKLSQLADDLGDIGDSKNLTSLIATLGNPRIQLTEWHVFSLVRAAAAVGNWSLVESAYSLLPKSEDASPYLLSAVLSARSRGGRLAEGLEEFERFVRRENPLNYINNRVCGQALNLATRLGLKDRALDILGFMKTHQLRISAVDLTIVVKNLTDSSSMLELLREFLPVTAAVDSQIFLAIFKRTAREFERLHQHAIRSGTIVSGLERLRDTVDECIELMTHYKCELNHYIYPVLIRLYSDLNEPIKADKFFNDSVERLGLTDYGVREVLSGVYHPAVRSFILEVGHYAKTNRRLVLPVHEILNDIQRLTYQNALRPQRSSLSRDDYMAALGAFSDQLDLLDALLVLFPQFAPTTLVRKLSLVCEHDSQAGIFVLTEILAYEDLETKLDSDSFLLISQSIARMANYEFMEQWLTRLQEINRLSPDHLMEVINCAVAEAKMQKYSFDESSAMFEKCEKLINRMTKNHLGNPIMKADWQHVLIHLLRSYSSIGDHESVLRLEREMQEQGVESGAIGLGLMSDVLLDLPNDTSTRGETEDSWKVVTILFEDIVHEFNQPLLGATNSLKLLKKRILSGSGKDQLLESLSRMERHIQRISERVSEYSHSVQIPESSVMSADVEPVLLGVLSKFENTIVTLGVKIIKIDSPEKGKAAPMNSVLLRIILNNAIRNSLEAIEEAKTANPEIRIAYGRDRTVRLSRKRYYITVEDNGPGIPQTILDTVWMRGVTTKDERGLGLGLPLIRTVINHLGGDLRVVSPLPGRTNGTRLIVRI